MKKYRRKIISLLLTAAMLITAVPILAAPDGDDYPAAPDEIIQTEAAAAEAAEAEQIETILTTEPEIEAIDAAANDGAEPAAEVATPAPTLNPKDEEIYIVSANFRQHPATSSIFKDQNPPTKLLWVEFSNKVDHSANFDEGSRTYKLNDNYYQLIVSRPEHGPNGPEATPHPAATMIPDNGIDGEIRSEFTSDTTKHRYHGWALGTDDMFDKDETNEYQVGKYTVSLMKLYPTEDEIADKDKLMHCAKRDLVNEKSLDVVEVKYTLSQEDKDKGYKLICANEPNNKEQTEITELAMVGDWITIIDPSVDNSQVQGTDDDKNMSISSWKIVKNGKATESAGAKIPAGNADEVDDNKITLEAVLTAPANYSYEYQIDNDNGTTAFPSASPAASYNQLASTSGEPKEIEYEPEATIEPLRLRVVNTGNRRSSINTYSSNDTFTVKTINQNTDDDANKLYSEGGLEANKALFYIPSQADIKNHPTWKNYAILEITPKKGLSVGTHHGQIYSYNTTSNYRIPQRYDIDITISPKEVDIEPLSTTKPYGKELTAADIICNVYGKNGETLESGKTAAELGVVIQSEGMKEEATVNNGQLYEYTGVGEGQSTGNYKVQLKEGTKTGITVEKATPRLNNVKATAISDGVKLSTSHLSGFYVNPHSHKEVEGSLDWVNPDEVIPVGQGETISRNYKFTPKDTDNYNTPAEGSVNITVSARRDSNLTLSNLEKTYNGNTHKPTLRWDRYGVIEVGRNVKVVYKKLADGDDRNFAADEEFTDTEGYSEDAPKEAGEYKVHAETVANDQYFAPDSANAIMTIKPYTLELSLKPGSVKDKMYDGTTTAEIDVSKVDFKKKIVASDEVSVKASAFTASFSSAYVEPYSPKIVTVNVNGENALEGKDAANYTLATAKLSTTGYISTQRPIKLELKETIKKHYGETYSFTTNDYKAAADQPSPGGLASGDSIENVNATLKAEKNGVDGTTANAPVDDYTVTALTPNTDNYNYKIEEDALGTLSVIKTKPQPVSVNADNGLAGNTLKSLEDEHFAGTFQNPYNHEDVKGKLEWVNPDEVLRKDKSEYEYRFTPDDLTNYEIITGNVAIVVTDKDAAKIAEWNVPSPAPYDGQPRIATIIAESPNAQTKVEYKKTDIELHNSSDDDGWTPEPPVNAGTYLVRGTIFAFDDFADNYVEGTIEILQAEPKGSVTASNVDKGAYLGDSQLTASFTGINNAAVEGTATWNTQDGVAPNEIQIVPDTEYEWIFIPEDTNYKPVTGKTKIEFNIDTRKAEAVIYNLPANYDELGDYAYVNVDKSIFKVGDAVRFYGDQAMTNPESERFVITDEMNGLTLVNIDDDALSDQNGTLYLNIEGSTAVASIDYKAEIGFSLNPDQLELKEGESTDISIKKSDESYEIKKVDWTLENSGTANVTGKEDNSGASITGTAAGSTTLTASTAFKHPDSKKADKEISITNSATINVTATATPAPPTEAPSATPAPATEAPSATPAPPTEAPSATPAPATEAPSATPAPPTEAPSATPAPATEAPSATPAPATEAPSATPAPATETPSATPAPPTEAPSATPAPPTEAPSATPAPPTEAPSATPAPATEAPSATPALATEAPSATPAPATETPAPVETATPAPVETATPDPGAPVRYDAAPVLNKDTATATITNNSGKSVWFIAAAYRDGVLIDIRFVEAPAGTNTVSAKFGSDYSADNSVSVTFYLWEKDTLKPCADPVQGK